MSKSLSILFILRVNNTNIDYGTIIVIAVVVHFIHTLPTTILMGRTFYNCRKAEKIY